MYDSWNPQSQKNDIERSNLFVNIFILALTVGVLQLNRQSVYLNAQNVRLNALNVINNQKSAESGKQTLEVLHEINNKIN